MIPYIDKYTDTRSRSRGVPSNTVVGLLSRPRLIELFQDLLLVSDCRYKQFRKLSGLPLPTDEDVMLGAGPILGSLVKHSSLEGVGVTVLSMMINR